MEILRRWVAFNGVGAMGVIVQLGVLGFLVHVAGVHYLVATVIAVEAALLHNFAWHQRWTWRDRPSASTASRLARFHILNGALSIAGNLGLMAILTGAFGVHPLAANVVAILMCSTLNFAASNALVFKAARVCALLIAVVVALPSTARAADVGTAELTPAAIAAWQEYQRQVDARYARPAVNSDPFFILDAFKKGGWRQLAMSGQISMFKIDSALPGGSEPSIPDGRVHHWAGAVFIPGAKLENVLRTLRDRAGRESESYEDVVASKLISRNGDSLRVYMKLRRENVITVTYNTEHAVEYRQLGGARASSRSIATKIAEIGDAGTPREHEKPVGNDHGFLWRLNAYWRFEQLDGGVLIECESVSLSRSVPIMLRPFVSGMVERIAKESLQKTLVSMRKELTR